MASLPTSESPSFAERNPMICFDFIFPSRFTTQPLFSRANPKPHSPASGQLGHGCIPIVRVWFRSYRKIKILSVLPYINVVVSQ